MGQIQTADLQTHTWDSLTRTLVGQTSTSVRLFRLAISDGNSNMIYNLPVCKSVVCICRTPLLNEQSYIRYFKLWLISVTTFKKGLLNFTIILFILKLWFNVHTKVLIYV